MIRGIRGAITVKENTSEAILAATKALLAAIIDRNNLHIPDIASIFFTLTPDLNADFPAKAARHMGLTETPLLCFQEIPVPNQLPKCIRVLFHLNTDEDQSQMQHVYLEDAIQLRPDHAVK